MSVTTHIDSIASVETLLNEMFQHVFQNDGAREHLGFSNISQVFSSDGFPGWYLWFSKIKGAYYIGISGENIVYSGQAFENSNQRIALREVQLVIRYFPDPEEDAFETFSCFEQIFRMRSDFDATGTPTFEGGCAMQESFYVVGHITIMLDSHNNYIDFFCRAPERWRDYRTDGLTLFDSNDKKIQMLSPGDCDRDVEGWNLSRHIFDKIVSAYIFLIHSPPSIVGASMRSSVQYLIDKSNNIQQIETGESKEFSLLVAFGQKVNLADARARLTSKGETFIGLWNDFLSIPPEWHDQLWWSISDHHFHQDNCCLCSCYNDH